MAGRVAVALLSLSLFGSHALAQCSSGPPPKPPGATAPPPPPVIPGTAATAGPAAPSPAGMPTPFGDRAAPSTPRGPAAPASPATGGPRGPVATAPAAPATGGARGPAAAAPGAPTPRGPGRLPVPMTFDRGRTSKQLLELRWDYPVYVPGPDEHTRVPAALPRDQAFAAVANGDRRPLLVLRECSACAGSNLALLAADACNDRTLTLARWFHCVKLEPEVVEPQHAFRNLFGEQPAHLFLCLADGSATIDLDGRQSQNQLWQALATTLRNAYDADTNKTTKQLLALLDDFDRVDAEIARLQGQLDQAIDQHGPRAPRVAELQKKLAAAQADHRALLARERQLRDLGQPKPGG